MFFYCLYIEIKYTTTETSPSEISIRRVHIDSGGEKHSDLDGKAERNK